MCMASAEDAHNRQAGQSTDVAGEDALAVLSAPDAPVERGSAPEEGAREAHSERRAQARLELNEPERRLLGDLFAIVSEHAADSTVEIDRGRVQDAFVFACEHHAAQRRQVR